MGAELVKKDFELFLRTNAPDACLENVDEILLDYIAEVLGDLGSGEENSFDVDQFSEMISAYVPEFSSIKCSVVCQWVFELADKQQRNTVKSTKQKNFHVPKATRAETESSKQISQSKPNSVTNDSEASPSHSVASATTTAGNAKEVSLLREMFPNVGEEKISAVLERCRGGVEDAIQELLSLPEEYDGGRVADVKVREKVHTDPSKTEVCGDKDIKESVLARYAFVDTDEDKITHRPVLAKQEPKKMVRYRDGHVVNTKGERFTVLTKKDAEGEDMKKTYVNLNPLRKYRFH